MDNKQLRELIIRPTLEELGMYSEDAENLVAGTIAQESRMGQYIKQVGGGPALGICQMEPATHDDIWDNFIRFRPDIGRAIMKINAARKASDMVYNLRYAIAMCRVHYYRQRGAIPSSIAGQATYWKQHYNTLAGKGNVAEYVDNYGRYAND